MTFIEFLGHLSFAVGAAAWLFRDVVKIRLIAICASGLSVVFNGLVWYNLPAGTAKGEMWVVIVWIAIIATINAAMLVVTIRESMEVPLLPSEKLIAAATFPDMKSRDWRRLCGVSRTTKHKAGSVLLEKGDSTEGITIVVAGTMSEERNGIKRVCPSATMWGELTYIFENDYNQSPVTIVCESDVSCMFLRYEDLRVLSEKHPSIAVSLLRGFVRSAGLKHGLLWVEAGHQSKPNLKV